MTITAWAIDKLKPKLERQANVHERPQAGLPLRAGDRGLSYPPDCPFKTQRAGLARQRLISLGLLGAEGRFEIAPRKAAPHRTGAIPYRSLPGGTQRAAHGDLTVDGLQCGLGGPDTPVFKDMFEYGAWAGGGGLDGGRPAAGGPGGHCLQPAGGFHHARPRRQRGSVTSMTSCSPACEWLKPANGWPAWTWTPTTGRTQERLLPPR